MLPAPFHIQRRESVLIEGKTFWAGREIVDGNEYVDCNFNGTTFVYRGGDLPDFTSCTFNNYRVEFEEAALNTLLVLQAMGRPGSGFEPVFAQMFPAQA